VTLQAGDDLADLGRIGDDGEHRHPASAPGAGHHVQLMNLGQQPRPGFPARDHANLAVQWPALGLALRGIGEHGILGCLPAVPAGGRLRSDGRTVLPGSASPRRVQPVAAHEELAPRRYMQSHPGDEVKRGVPALPALEIPRGGGGPGDGVLLLVPADALQGKRGTHDILAPGLARVLVPDAGPALDGETGVFPAEELAGEGLPPDGRRAERRRTGGRLPGGPGRGPRSPVPARADRSSSPR